MLVLVLRTRYQQSHFEELQALSYTRLGPVTLRVFQLR